MAIIEARAKAFSREPVRKYRFWVDDTGTVRVWDSLAGHYTTLHRLSPRAEARIRKLADQAEAGQC